MIVVLGVLAGVAVPKFYDHANRARMTSYIMHVKTVRITIGQYEQDVLTSAPSVPWVITSSNFASSPLADRFMHNPFVAFGGVWGYRSESSGGGVASYLSGQGLPRIGTCPAAGYEFMRIASGDQGNILNDFPEVGDTFHYSSSASWSLQDYTHAAQIIPLIGPASMSSGPTVSIEHYFTSW